MSEETEPYIVYRIADGQVECSLWQLREGPRALALFLSPATATAYREANNLGAEWQVFQPDRQALLHLLRACHDGGIDHAVMEPDREKAKSIFDVKAILATAGG